MTPEERRAHIERLAAEAPPFTDEFIARCGPMLQASAARALARMPEQTQPRPSRVRRIVRRRDEAA